MTLCKITVVAEDEIMSAEGDSSLIEIVEAWADVNGYEYELSLVEGVSE